MQKPVHIVLVEDDHEDAELFGSVLRESNPLHKLDVMADAEVFLEHLAVGLPLPDIIVMDLNLPKIHGHDLLKSLKNNELYRDVPVLILTTSSAAEDRDYSKALGALDFFVKPNTLKELNV